METALEVRSNTQNNTSIKIKTRMNSLKMVVTQKRANTCQGWKEVGKALEVAFQEVRVGGEISPQVKNKNKEKINFIRTRNPRGGWRRIERSNYCNYKEQKIELGRENL